MLSPISYRFLTEINLEKGLKSFQAEKNHFIFKPSGIDPISKLLRNSNFELCQRLFSEFNNHETWPLK